MRLGQVWLRINRVQENENEPRRPSRSQSPPLEDETEEVLEKNSRQALLQTDAETTVGPKSEEESSRYPSSWQLAEDDAESEQALLGPAAPRSIEEPALGEFVESPVVLNIQADGTESDGSEDVSGVAWPCGTVLSIWTLGLLAAHHRFGTPRRDSPRFRPVWNKAGQHSNPATDCNK